MILAGDVGGTKTGLALFDRQGAGFTLVREDAMPVHLVLESRTALLGAARVAQSLV